MPDREWLLEVDHRVLTALGAHDDAVGLDALAAEVDIDPARVKVALDALATGGFVAVLEETALEYRLGPKGRALAGRPLPERAVIEALVAGAGAARIAELASTCGLEAREAGESLRWLAEKGWARRTGEAIALTEAGRAAAGRPDADEVLLAVLAEAGGRLGEAELRARGVDLDRALTLFDKRKQLVERKDRVRRSARCLAAGRALLAAGVRARREVTQLTPELLADGKWRDVEIKPYDVTLAAETLVPGKEHPFRRVLEETRRVFLEMGFTEIVSPCCESSFWDFDALFQPQDHPARDLQDTFYVKRPAAVRLPSDSLVGEVAATHENGGSTGSIGWGYRWDKALATRPVLRTHTTAATIRALAADPRPPRKVFCVGPVFRNETITYKHLPVFHQVDGIIIDRAASLACLLGTLGAFYRKMGFKRFQFRPAFFPYTEPSVEVFVWHEVKGDWVEMGGSGLFRPEVTRPFGCEVPVLAWGLGLERLAMFRYGIERIRELYDAPLEWLKETPTCRS
ncbi:MAG: phenylalanine--tRNA ligase subunit alpha [Planctomycetes bacterium]|nr:phenylalanine--tRNA ligase subunit alpha [Planctomycetota bacterium]